MVTILDDNVYVLNFIYVLCVKDGISEDGKA